MIEVEILGLEETIRNVMSYANSLDRKKSEICRRLADIGIDVASAWYDIGTMAGKQSEGVNLEVVPTSEGCMIRAYGDTVFFLEFGTGVYATSNEMNTEGLDTAPGSWSKDHVKMFIEKGYWYHKETGFIGEGTEPYPGMNYARGEILRQIQTIASEVLDDRH